MQISQPVNLLKTDMSSLTLTELNVVILLLHTVSDSTNHI